MFLNYLKLAFRQVFRFKVLSLINILGLSAGLAACFVILVYLKYQTSYDRYNKNLDNVYLITKYSQMFGTTDPGTPMVLGPTMQNEIHGIQTVARWSRRRGAMQYRDKTFQEDACICADPELFDILTLPLVEGSLDAIRKEHDFLVISESMARKYFGDRSPIGETIRLQCGKESYELKVTAVMKDLPPTSTMVADAIGPLYVSQDFLADIWHMTRGDVADSWTVPGGSTFILVSASANVKELETKIIELSKRHLDPARTESFHLFPLRDVYFHSSFMINNTFRQGNIANVYIYTAVTVLILFISCVNYLLVSLGRASLRIREVGVRKVFGARRFDLLAQTLVEAIVVTVISLPIAVILVELFLRDLSALLGTTIADSYFHNMGFVGAFFLVALFIGLVSGSYIALYIGRFTPTAILKGTLISGTRKVHERKILLISQMIIFLGLTLTSLIVLKQIDLFRSQNNGFETTGLYAYYPDADEFAKNFEAFKTETEKFPGTLAVSGAMFLPGTLSSATTKFPRKDDPTRLVSVENYSVERGFIETMGMKMAAGESFDRRNKIDGGHDCILNETAVRELGLSNPIGSQVAGFTVIGVVHDFNMHSLHDRIPPVALRQGTSYLNEVVVRLTSGNERDHADRMSKFGAKFNNGKPLEYESFDERLGSLYTKEQEFASTIGYATGLAIFVACLGIFGMSIFVCQQKVREIGIRKVLGASLSDAYYRLTREFVGLILLSSLIAFPLATYLINQWLQQFAYRVGIGVLDYSLAALVDIVIVVVTVSFQSLRAATANPITSLRYE